MSSSTCTWPGSSSPASLLAGVYAFARLRGRWGRYERTACAIPLAAAAVASIAEGPIGDWAARDVATTQPSSSRRWRACTRTTHGAPEHLLGWYTGGRIKYGIEIPHLLSVLAFHSWNASVAGLASVPAGRSPAGQRVACRVPVDGRHGDAAGAGLGRYLVVWIRDRRLPQARWFYWALVVAGPLSVVALIAGWVVTEVGRQPWVVYGVMRTDAAVTGARGIPVGYGVLVVSYVVVGCGLVWVLGAWRARRSTVGARRR